MPPELLLKTTGPLAWLGPVAAAVMVLKVLAPVVQTWIVERFRTRRLDRALVGTAPDQRFAIIVAVSKLDGSRADPPSGDTRPAAPDPPASPRSDAHPQERGDIGTRSDDA
jgi:hypothetical protein